VQMAFALPTWCSVTSIVILVLLSGLFSGLTLGLMGLDLIGLQTVEKGGNQNAAKCAAKIAPVRRRGNQLLCTLLLGNVAVNSAMSILTAEIANGPVGFFVSTALIVLFGEIFPQAICSRYALQIGAHTVTLVKFLMALLYIFTKPISLLLDAMLGKDLGLIYTTSELIEMVKLQIHLGATDEETGQMAKQVVEGALCFRNKRVAEAMTPVEDVYMLQVDTRLDYCTIRDIFDHGFSRVPVYGTDKNDYRGVLYSKDLMLVDPEDEMKIGDFIQIFERRATTFRLDTTLATALNAFKKGKTHIALVRELNTKDELNPKCELRGVLTLEDVIEEFLQEEIVDETDVYVDIDHHVKVNDGREERRLNLGVFNPVWHGPCEERLHFEEVGAIAAHLARVLFTREAGMSLSSKAVQWLVAASTVQNLTRITPGGLNDVPLECDRVYLAGEACNKCTLILQGRMTLKVGRECFHAEVGAFALIGRDALRADTFIPDFSAYLGTSKVRCLVISKDVFTQAQALDANPDALEKASIAQANHGKRTARLRKFTRKLAGSNGRLHRALSAGARLMSSPQSHQEERVCQAV